MICLCILQCCGSFQSWYWYLNRYFWFLALHVKIVKPWPQWGSTKIAFSARKFCVVCSDQREKENWQAEKIDDTWFCWHTLMNMYFMVICMHVHQFLHSNSCLHYMVQWNADVTGLNFEQHLTTWYLICPLHRMSPKNLNPEVVLRFWHDTTTSACQCPQWVTIWLSVNYNNSIIFVSFQFCPCGRLNHLPLVFGYILILYIYVLLLIHVQCCEKLLLEWLVVCAVCLDGFVCF